MAEPTSRLYLIAPSGADEAFGATLETALRAGDVACVLLPSTGPALQPLVGIVQGRGAAALIADDSALAIRCEADGVHVAAGGDLKAAARQFKPTGIVGAGGFATRDDAMTAAEGNVDYVMLGDTTGGERPPPFDDRLDRVAWWTEIFEVPCVAVAHALDEVEDLAATGTEFVALGDAVWHDPRGAGPAIGDAMQALREGHARYLAIQAERA